MEERPAKVAAGDRSGVEVGDEVELAALGQAQGVDVVCGARFLVLAGDFTARGLAREQPFLFTQRAVAVEVEAAQQLGAVFLPLGQQQAEVAVGVEVLRGAAQGAEVAEGVERVVGL